MPETRRPNNADAISFVSSLKSAVVANPRLRRPPQILLATMGTAYMSLVYLTLYILFRTICRRVLSVWGITKLRL
jgi:hypothetical protein